MWSGWRAYVGCGTLWPMKPGGTFVLVWLALSCGGNSVNPGTPTGASEGEGAEALAPQGKRAACTFGRDETCNGDPAISALWGRCTPLGTCECSPGFELAPSGFCRPASQQP